MGRILKSASTVKIGKRFSNKRISLSLSLEEASKILYINEDYLNACLLYTSDAADES